MIENSGCFKTPFNRPLWRGLALLVVLLFAFSSLAWIGSEPEHHRAATTRTPQAHTVTRQPIHYTALTTVPKRAASATPIFYLNTGTPLPPDWVNNAEETNSIIIGAFILILIVLVGTFSVVRAKK